MASNTRYDIKDNVVVNSPAVEEDGKEGWVEDIRNPDSDSPDYLVRFPDQPDGSAPFMFKASELRKVGAESWEEKAKEELEDKLDVKTQRFDYKFYEEMYGVDVFAVESTTGEANNGEREWIVFKTPKDAWKAAIKKVKNDLEIEPGLYNDSFLEDHIYITDTDRRMIAQDDAYFYTEDRDLRDLKDMAERHGVDYEEHEDSEITRERLREKVEMAMSEEIEEELKDPIQYFVHDKGIYSKEDLMEQSFIRIDVEKAAEDAVDTDGVGHFLDVYDFEPVHLPSGALAYGVN